MSTMPPIFAPGPLLAGLLALACAACGPIGPDYVRPQMADLPGDWKTAPGWRSAHPADGVPKQAWWTAFGDAQLDALEAHSLDNSPTLQAALARLDQAEAQSRVHAAALYPSVALNAGATRSRISANRPLTSSAQTPKSIIQNDLKPALTVSYELDWLGRVRRDVESARASAEQAVADQENVRLVLTAQVASTYFQLRQLDEEIAAVTASTQLQDKIFGLIRIRHDLGAASDGDLAVQSALAEASQAQLELLRNQRKTAEDALGTLTGTPAAAFRLPPGHLPGQVPAVPPSVPTDLLERRPDIAAAERAMAAANAQIGVARAAFFPTLTLAPALAGFESTSLLSLFSTSSLIWSLGLQAAQPLFDGGRIRAGVDFAEAAYAATVANYRQTVLQAIQEAQDALGTLHGLENARQRQDEAVRQQNKAGEITLLRYKEGLDNALTLATVQQNQLAAQRTQSQIRGGQFVACVSLLKALGGGWQDSAP